MCCKTVLFLITHVYLMQSFSSLNVCDGACMCRYDNKNEDGINGEFIDCSYSPNVIQQNYSLPKTVHLLDLSFTNLTRVCEWSLLRSQTMVELVVRNNNLTEIEPYSFKLPELKRLDLSNNNLEFVHEDVFKYLRQLQILNLANNKFTTFSKLTFYHLSNLKEITLDENDIGIDLQRHNLFDRNGFGLTHKIQYLSISGINLNKIPENFFADAYDIKTIIISNNNLTELFEIPFTLEILDISNNPIRELYEEKFDLPALKELKMNNLQIKEIPDFIFSSLKGLTNLELERNRNLTKFSYQAFGREVLDDPDDFLLEKLSLRMSRLTSLDERLLMPFGQLIHLDLEGNSWNCNCSLVWFKKLQLSPDYYDNLRCASPKHLFNKRIFDIKPQYFTCSVNKHLIGISMAVIAFCVVLSTVALWLFIFLPKYQSRCQSMLPIVVNGNKPL